MSKTFLKKLLKQFYILSSHMLSYHHIVTN
jgi:hypothetical protein